MLEFSTAQESLLGEIRTTSFTNYKCSNIFALVSHFIDLQLVYLLVGEHTGKPGFDYP